METLQIDILDPKAKNLLKNLADLRLISIRTANTSKKEFMNLLERLRSRSGKAPSIKEITKVVETVREQRYAK